MVTDNEPVADDTPALLVDFGGVLTASVMEAFGNACVTVGVVDPHRFVAECFSADSESPFALLELGRIRAVEFADLITPLLTRYAATPVDGRDWMELVQKTTWDIDEAMVSAIDRLIGRGVPTALVSNSWGPAADYPWALLPKFSEVLVSSEVGLRKPDPEIYLLAAQRLGRDAAECLFVDDVEVNLVPARELGMHTVLHRCAADTVVELARIYG
jgi:putative hydrolase of the HAD superfamily